MTRNELMDMTSKAKIKDIADRYDMDYLLEDEVTRQIVGLWKQSDEPIPELDAIVDIDLNDGIRYHIGVAGERWLEPDGRYMYRLICPTEWFDICGWR